MYDNRPWQASDLFLLRVARRNAPMIAFLLVALASMLTVYWYFSPVAATAEIVAAGSGLRELSAPIFKAVPAKPVTQRLPQSPGPLRIGIIAGHAGHDPGAVCEDGLTEVEVNQRIADMVVAHLRAQRIRADLLEEFDARLPGYSATAVVSIHADSCDYFNDLATGFKIAGSSFTDSSQLSICVEQAYRLATSLPYHANTITPHMTDYHAFRQIAPGTPAIIIETGFMNLDRKLLTTRAEIPARAISDGILCFIREVRP